MQVNGNLDLGGATLSLDKMANFDSGFYKLFGYTGTLNGSLAIDPSWTPGPGWSASIDTASRPGVVLLNVVPEPGTVAMLTGLAVMGMVWLRRRRGR